MAADTTPIPADAETWLRSRYGAYRGHFAWRELEEAFNAGRAQPAASPAPLTDEQKMEAHSRLVWDACKHYGKVGEIIYTTYKAHRDAFLGIKEQ